MTDNRNQSERRGDGEVANMRELELIKQVNAALLDYSDKDWNYSRITLIIKPLSNAECPYVLKIEILDQNTKEGRNELKTLSDEVKWGDRHSSELGMLELVSLRINKALIEVTSNDYWNQKRPVVRVIKQQPIDRENTTQAIWYHITEVAGEDFD